MGINTVFAFFLIISVMVMPPGPNSALLLKTVPISGKKHGYVNVIGVISAFYLHGTLSIFGLSAIIASSANLFFIVKLIGAIYLAYLGIKAIISAFTQPHSLTNSTVQKTALPPKNLSSCFLEGLLTNLLNPKVSIFYLAAFPQFISLESNAVVTSYTLVTIHALFAALWFSAMVLLIGKSTSFLKSSRAYMLLQSLTGTVLLWFSYRIATTKT